MSVAPPRPPVDRSTPLYLALLIGLTLFVAVSGILVVRFPHTFGLPGLGATPTALATPAADSAP